MRKIIQGMLSGTIVSSQTSDFLPYAAVAVMKSADSSFVSGVMANGQGYFVVNNLAFGTYFLKLSFVGYDLLKTESFTLNPAQPDKNFGNIQLKPSANNLKGVTIEEKQVRVEQKNDTIQYNANAYKTHPDATVEDLVNKMPGVSTDKNGNVTAHSEQVKQVLVDGKPFFGDDPSMALKNLPSDVVDKIQIFDKLSDQAQFTGFDDGTSQKTMNIVTRAG